MRILLAVLLASSVAAAYGQKTEKAIFAMGCFWCAEEAFETVPGVTEVVSGYTGGKVKNPSYELVSLGVTGHAGSVQVEYDPALVSYEQLLEVFWRNVDPTDPGGQFCDRGSQYRTAIFYEGESQKRAAEESKRMLARYANLPFYAKMLTASGFGDEIGAIAAAWKRRDVDAAERAVSDRMADSVTLVGDRARCRARLEAFRAAGATAAIVFVNPVGESRAAAVERALTALAP